MTSPREIAVHRAVRIGRSAARSSLFANRWDFISFPVFVVTVYLLEHATLCEGACFRAELVRSFLSRSQVAAVCTWPAATMARESCRQNPAALARQGKSCPTGIHLSKIARGLW